MEGADTREYAQMLGAAFASAVQSWQAAGIQIDDWAWESKNDAENIAYGPLLPKVPIERPVPVHSCADDNDIGTRLLRLHIVAGAAYQDAAAPVVEKRMAQAGVRLAMILNMAAKAIASTAP